MKNWQELLSSGLLELYVLGDTNAEENELIEDMMLLHPEIKLELHEIALVMEKYALQNAIEPDPTIKPFLLATIDYSDRMKNGEAFSAPPVLHENSLISDYKEWIERADMHAPTVLENIYAKILSYSAECITAIVWLKEMAPQEVHDKEYERFLILEGTCTIHVEEKKFKLQTGDYFQIPLHSKHHVEVTSSIPCKVILQRVAA